MPPEKKSLAVINDKVGPQRNHGGPCRRVGRSNEMFRVATLRNDFCRERHYFPVEIAAFFASPIDSEPAATTGPKKSGGPRMSGLTARLLRFWLRHDIGGLILCAPLGWPAYSLVGYLDKGSSHGRIKSEHVSDFVFSCMDGNNNPISLGRGLADLVCWPYSPSLHGFSLSG
jgi:hypothetical protein